MKTGCLPSVITVLQHTLSHHLLYPRRGLIVYHASKGVATLQQHLQLEPETSLVAPYLGKR